MDIDYLTQIIRKVDGSHNLGACALAEAIISELWQPIETAPKGEWVERKAGDKGVTSVHVPKRIIGLMSNGDWTVTYWIDSQQRWNMFSKNSPPRAWLLPPEANT